MPGNLIVGAAAGTTPATKLSVWGASALMGDLAVFSNDATGPSLYLRKSRNATVGSNTIITTGDQIGQIEFASNNGSGWRVSCVISADSEGTIASNRTPGRLSFWTATNVAPSVITERMRIDNSGGVFMYNLKSGTNQATAGAALNELWRTSGHATLPDNVVMIGELPS